MDYRDPKVLFGLGVLGVFALLALTDAPSALLFNPGPSPGPMPPAGALPGGPLPTATTGLTSRLSNLFFQRVNELAAYMRSRGATITGEDILAVLVPESGVDPARPNSIRCLGLNQICPKLKSAFDPERVSGLRAVGFKGSQSEYLALPAEEQLQYVKAYFDNVNQYRAFRDYGTLYLANFSPAFLGKPDNFVMYPSSHPSYPLNAGVDHGPKGYIEVADMAKFVKRTLMARKSFWDELRMRLANANTAVAGLNDEEAMIRIALANHRTG